MKSAVQNERATKMVRGLRNTKDGNLLITLDKNMEAFEEIQKKIVDKAQSLKVRRAEKKIMKTQLHIRDMDATTEKADVERAIRQTL